MSAMTGSPSMIGLQSMATTWRSGRVGTNSNAQGLQACSWPQSSSTSPPSPPDLCCHPTSPLSSFLMWSVVLRCSGLLLLVRIEPFCTTRCVCRYVENGGDQDAEPIAVTMPLTGHEIDSSFYSRLRTQSDETSGTVMG